MPRRQTRDQGGASLKLAVQLPPQPNHQQRGAGAVAGGTAHSC